MCEKEWDLIDSIESLSEDLKSESDFLTRIATAVRNLKDQRDKLLVDNERLREKLASQEAMWYLCHDGSEDACCKVHE